jgi:hypothetical protein
MLGPILKAETRRCYTGFEVVQELQQYIVTLGGTVI